MTAYNLDSITQDVLRALNHNVSSAFLEEIGDVDTLSFNDIIRSKIVESVKRVHSEAPMHLLDGGKPITGNITWSSSSGSTSGSIDLPDDFMRLVVFEMSDWDIAVFEAPSVNSPQYVTMRSKYKGLRGTPERPQCFISLKDDGRVLEFYSCKDSSATIKRAVYLPMPQVTTSSGGVSTIGICERCYDAVVYTIAALVSIILGNKEAGSALSELAKSTLL